MMTLLLLASLAISPERPDLSGNILSEAGKPVLDARVSIFTAAARVGINPFCPSCYADCAKSSTTDREGSFLIRALDPSLIFRVLVVKEGFEPTFVERTDPLKGPLRVTLKPIDPSRLEPRQVIRGRVVDEEGNPLGGVVVSPNHFKTAKHWGFAPGIFDPLAVTNADGNFLLTSNSPIEYVDVKLEARGFAVKIAADLSTANADIKLPLGRGVSVSGRVVAKGRPLPGVGVGLTQVDRSLGGDLKGRSHVVNHSEIATDDTGRFLFSNISPNDELYVYGLMGSLKTHGAIPVRKLTTGDHGSHVNLGDLAIEEGHSLSGRVLLSDGKPVPPHTRILVSADRAWDFQMVELDEEGHFVFDGLPTEIYSVSSLLKGYKLSMRNECASPLNRGLLEGMIDRNVSNLTLLYEPGDPRGVRPPDQNDPVVREVVKTFVARRTQLIRGVNPPSDQ